MRTIHELPKTVDDIFEHVSKNKGYLKYKIFRFNRNTDVSDNILLQRFISAISIPTINIAEVTSDSFTLLHHGYDKEIVISYLGGGHNFSLFECSWKETDKEDGFQTTEGEQENTVRHPRNGLRPATFYIKDVEYKGYLHMFYQEGNMSDGLEVMALMEAEDGTLHQVYTNKIQFDDIEVKYKSI